MSSLGRTAALLALSVGVIATPPVLGSAVTARSEAAPVVRGVTVTGTGVATYPTYSSHEDRFAVRTTAATEGRLTVLASSPDSAATITVDGRPAVNGVPTEVAGLTSGDEVSVAITDSAGATRQSWVYLPAGFPAVTTTGDQSNAAAQNVALTLAADADTFETVVDLSGVPRHVAVDDYSMNLMAQPNGHYSVARGVTRNLYGSFDIVELDEDFREVATHRTSLSSTDFHDVVLLPGGGRILMAYIRNPSTNVLESHVEETDSDGDVVLSWSSADHIDAQVDPVTQPFLDNAHLNSIDVMRDGNLLLSFRHLSQVMKVHRSTGEVIWRLGGVRSDFDFPDDPFHGPCAQHTARELDNGDIQIFDNGAALTTQTHTRMCPPDPGAGSTDRVERPSSRVTVYRLDETTGQAHLVASHELGGFAQFAGSAQRLGTDRGTLDDHVLAGISNGFEDGGAGAALPDAVELAPDGSTVWALSAEGFASYRALAVPWRDRRDPQVTLDGLVDGAVLGEGEVVRASYSCTDRGGSSLATCSGTVASGSPVPTTPGTHTITVSATDRAGNSTSRSVRYTVVAAPAPSPVATSPAPAEPVTAVDASARTRTSGWRGQGRHARRRATITLATERPRRLVAWIRIRNTGTTSTRATVRGDASRPWMRVRWFAGRTDVTRRVVAGRYRTRLLRPGGSARLRLVADVRDAGRARSRILDLAAAPVSDTGGHDVVGVRVRVR